MRGFIQNCSLCEGCESLSELQTNSVSEFAVSKLCEFIFIGSIVVELHMLDILICNEFQLKKIKLSTIKKETNRLVHIMSLSLLILTLPVITMLITLALMYKVVCSVVIKRKDKRFVKFLDSFDVFCCLEDKTTIDIQGIVRSNTIELAVDKIKDKLHNVFMNYGADKIFYRRNEDYGFYYWRRYSSIDLAQYVQIVEIPEKHKVNQREERMDGTDKIASYNDEGMFKVLIVKSNFEGFENDEYKIILKFHSSVKNVAQLEFVARLIDEKNDCNVTLNCRLESRDYNSPDALMSMIAKLCRILAQSFEDNSGRSRLEDCSFIRLKTLEWTKSDENLLSKVKHVTNEVSGLFR